MIRAAVESSTLASVCYAIEQSVLELEFHDGSVYSYLDVPMRCFHQLMAADSKGAYFNRHIRNCFQCQRVSEPIREN
jgi:hypothetical protein